MARQSTARRKVESLAERKEWQLRVELAAVYRIIDHLGWSELIWNHVTLRVPGPEPHFLINPYGLRYDEVRASNLVKIDCDGKVVGKSAYPINVAGFVIHSAIHMARPDAHCVLHTHTTAGMAVAAQEEGLLPIGMYAAEGFDGLAYHNFEGPSLDLDERGRIAKSLGGKNMLILRNHGLLTCGRTAAEAFVRMFRLERACQVQMQAQAGGAGLLRLTDDVAQRSAKLGDEFLTSGGTVGYGELEFAAMVRLIEAKDPSYKT